MKARLSIGPEVANARHHEREERREQFLQVIADVEIFLARFADDGRRIDRVAAVKDGVNMKDRVVVPQRVVAVVIAERAFRSSFVRWDVPGERELGFGNQPLPSRQRPPGHFKLPACQYGCQHQLRHVFGQGRNRRQNQGRRAAEKYCDGKPLARSFRLVVVKAPAFMDLPVQSGRLRIVQLHAIHTEIMLVCDGMLCVDERQGDERPAVFLPCCEDGQPVEPRGPVCDLRDGRMSHVARAEPQSFERERPVLPECCRSWGQK